MTGDTAKKEDSYVYEDYLRFSDDSRCEILDGQIHDMTPSPSVKHQTVAGKLFRIVGNHLETGEYPCRVFIAPTDVVLAEDQVVQPDVFLVCDQSKIREKAIFGAPDAVFEVLSPFTEVKDRREKMRVYELSGVREYFLVHPDQEFIEKYFLDGEFYRRKGLYGGEDILSVDMVDLEITARDLFTP